MDAGLTTRDLVRLVRLPMAERGDVPAVADLNAAIAELEAMLPLKKAEPGLDGQASRLIEDALRPIGAAIDPRFPANDSKVWRKALLLKLSNLPGPIVLKAVRKAMHESFRFFGDVEPKVRELANEAAEHQRIALWRMKRWRDEIEKALNPQPMLEAPPPEPATQEEVDNLNASMKRCGIATRWKLEGGEIVMATAPSQERRSEQ